MYRETEVVDLGDGKKQRGFRLPTMLACNFTVPNTGTFSPYMRNFIDYTKQVGEFFDKRKDEHFLDESFRIYQLFKT